MNVPWKTIRVFISSTFKDMQAERDHLVRFVFPKLREHLLKYRIHLIDVDLRWGVTSDQDAFGVCREVIDECHPRFMGMLGGRYGWVPGGQNKSITADEIHYGVLERDAAKRGRAFFYFRDPKATAEIVEDTPGDFREMEGSDAAIKLTALKQTISDAKLPVFIYPAEWNVAQRRLTGLETFGNQVHADLLQSLKDDPDLAAHFTTEGTAQPDEFAEEAEQMEAFIEERTQHYEVGSRQSLLNEMKAFVAADGTPNIFVLTGDPGSGKSALLAQFCRSLPTLPHANTPFLLLPHFIGASTGSTDLRRTLRRLCHELALAAGNTEPLPLDIKDLITHFQKLLAEAAGRRRIILVFDALNQFDATDGAHWLNWLPRELPPGVRIVASVIAPTDGQPEHQTLAILRTRPGTRMEKLGPLTEADALAVIEGSLRRYAKRLSPEQLAALLAKPTGRLPLYVLTALEELRTLGTYEEITARIRTLPGDARALFGWILTERLARDPGFRDREGRPCGAALVEKFAACLGVSRHGLSPAELTALLDPGDPLGNVAALLRLLRPYLMRRGELLDFYHGQFREAAGGAYLDTAEKLREFHQILAGYFERGWCQPDAHALSELPHHQTEGQMWLQLASTVSKVEFIAFKCLLGMPYEIQADYKAALAVCPEGAERSRIGAFSEAYAQEMIHLIEFTKHGDQTCLPDFVFQQLRNRLWRNTNGHLEIAEKERDREIAVLLHKSPPRASQFARRVEADAGSKLLRFDGTVRFTPDGNLLLVAVVRPKIVCIDPESGREVYTLPCVGRAVALDFSPDGNCLVVGGDLEGEPRRGFVQTFDLSNRFSIAVRELDVPAYTLVVTAAGEILTASCSVVHVLNLDTLEVKRKWEPHANCLVSAIAVNRARTLLVTGEMHDEDRSARIKIWDAGTLEMRAEFDGPKYGINSLAFSDLEGLLASGSCHLNNGVVAWHWSLPGTTIDQMLLSAQLRDKANELLKLTGRHQQVREGRVISTLETADSVNGLVFFPGSEWLVAIEGSHERASDAINVFSIFGSEPGNVGKVCGHSSVPVAVDIDSRRRWIATLHAKGEVMLWPAEVMKETKRAAPPHPLTKHSTDHTCRFVLSVEAKGHQYLHLTDTQSGRDILSGFSIPCHEAGLVPTQKHIVRFYWEQMPMNPYLGSDGTDEPARKWFSEFLSTQPVCCTVHPLAQLPAHRENVEPPENYHLIENLDLPGQTSLKWKLPPTVQARDLCFSRDGAWGAAILGSRTVPAFVFCFGPTTGESRRRSIPREIESGFLKFARDGSLCLIGTANKNKVVARFDLASSAPETCVRMTGGFGPAAIISIGPLPMPGNRFVAVRKSEEIVLFVGRSEQPDVNGGGRVDQAEEVATLRYSTGIHELAVSKDGSFLVVSDAYPSISVFQIPSFRKLLWRPMDQASESLFLNDAETDLLAIGKVADLDGLHYSLMDLPNQKKG